MCLLGAGYPARLVIEEAQIAARCNRRGDYYA
jgi:hypothetical protein